MEIEGTVKRAVEQTLQLKPLKVTKVDKGEFNKVFKAETEDGAIIARVFRHSHWPEDGKVQWIEGQLVSHAISHAKLLHYSRDTTFFEHGFMLTEYIEGKNGADAILDGDISFEDFHEKLASLLFKIHHIPVESYGLVNNGKGEGKTLTEFKCDQMKKDLQKLSSLPHFDSSFRDSAEDTIRRILMKFESRLRPVLTHADATPVNCIYTPDGQIILIDWDGALAESWVRDYSWMTYSGSHLSELGTREERQKKIREAFTKGYLQRDLDTSELAELESAYHAMRAIELLPYYYFDQKNMEAFEKTQDRLKGLVNRMLY